MDVLKREPFRADTVLSCVLVGEGKFTVINSSTKSFRQEFVALLDKHQKPVLTGLVTPLQVSWLDAQPGLGQLKPDDLDRVILMLDSLDLVFTELLGGTNPIEHWKDTVLSKTIDALKMELEKPMKGRYPDVLHPNNRLPQRTVLRLTIESEAVRAVHYFLPAFNSKVDRARLHVARIVRKHYGKGSLSSLKRWENKIDESSFSYISGSPFLANLPSELLFAHKFSVKDREAASDILSRTIDSLARQLKRELANEGRVQTTTRRRRK